MNSFLNINEWIHSSHLIEENHMLEFKEAVDNLPKSFWETYSSFANTTGGYIILGVSENFKHPRILGVHNPSKIKHELFTTANNKDKVSHNIIDNADVTEHLIDGKIIVSVHIKELPSNQKPLYLNGNPLMAYTRKNDSDCRISITDYQRFLRNAETNTDGQLLDNYTIEDLNLNSVLTLKNILSIREPSRNFMEMDNLDFLKEIGVFRIDRNDQRKIKLTLAGLLLLGKLDAITQKIPHFHLDYINKRGTAIERWRDRVSTGDSDYPDLNLFEFYQTVREKLRLTVEDKFALDARSIRKPSSELNRALREALANMIIHADYLDSETTLKVTVDNLYYTFENPGAMKISTAQFFSGGHSEPRNNTLIQYFRRMGESERAGTGGKEILDVISRNKYRQPDLTSDYKHTELTLWCAVPADTYENLSENAKKILKYLEDVTKATSSELKANLKLSSYYIRKALQELIGKNLIISKGKGRYINYYKSLSTVEVVDKMNQLAEKLKISTNLNQ